MQKFNIKGTKTEKNLQEAFAGESMARNKYTYYASKAKKEGYEQIAALFLETANNEKEHAKIWFKLLHDSDVPDTATNLLDAAQGENPGPTARHSGPHRPPACLVGSGAGPPRWLGWPGSPVRQR